MPSDFVEEVLDLGVNYGVIGGPGFQTSIVATGNGKEYRNIDWPVEQGSWNLGSRTLNNDDLKTLTDFFRRRRGRAVAFLYKDWNDWKSTDLVGPSPDGVITAFQLSARYGAGDAEVYSKPLAYLKASSETIQIGTVTVPSTQYTLDTSTGIVTFDANVAGVITGATQANPVVLSVANGNSFTVGESVHVDSVGGMTELNGNRYVIEAKSASSITITVDGTGFTAYTSGGNANTLPQTGEALGGAVEFYKRVRFDTDKIDTTFNAYEDATQRAIYSVGPVPIIEEL